MCTSTYTWNFFISTYDTKEGKRGKQWKISSFWALKSLRMVTAAMKWEDNFSWKKTYDKSRQVVKGRDTTLLTKVCIVKALVFPIIMYGCQSWTINKSEHQRIDAFKLWHWRRLLSVPLIAKRSNLKSILKEINPEYSLKGLMLKLKLQYIGHMMQRTDSLAKPLMCWERLDVGGKRGNKWWDGWDGITDWMDMTLSRLKAIVKNKKNLHAGSSWDSKLWNTI